MNILLLGAGNFIVNLCKELASQKHTIQVISNAVQLNKLMPNSMPIKDALSAYAKVSEVENESEIEQTLHGVDIEEWICISYGAPWIFKEQTIQRVFKNRLMNIHGTHLPKQRGGTLFSWQILSGQKTGMCLVHQLTTGIDQGQVLAYKEFIYPAWCRKPIDYISVYEEKNVVFVSEWINSWNGWPALTGQQPEYLSSYFPRLLAPVHGWINWSWNNTELERFILAFDEPYGGARCRLNNQVVILRDAYAQQMDGYFHPMQNGLIYRNNGEWINVCTNSGELLVKEVWTEDGRLITPEIKTGDRFYTLPEDLAQANQRVVKTKSGLSVKK